jgi:hypothetical protein
VVKKGNPKITAKVVIWEAATKFAPNLGVLSDEGSEIPEVLIGARAVEVGRPVGGATAPNAVLGSFVAEQ